MLIVKAIDMMQRASLAQNPEAGASALTTAGSVIAILGAILLFFLADGQVSEVPSQFGGY
ncbi:hypothetical protein K3175_08665 [Qipengyuania sp. GH1]|uniref:hypothetical protein n=1 Tax=Qipengyuania aestuarii TaxID=2867241 RepID=UPI001C879190|nr:hypothetical protein [Qipengyuania aestuarii]MBX7535732.1 hypothetical protein [Qipengyuania aestuarii]